MSVRSYVSEWAGEDEMMTELPAPSRQSISREFDQRLKQWRARVSGDPELAKVFKVLKKYEASGSAVSMCQKLKARYGPNPSINGFAFFTRRLTDGNTGIIVRYDKSEIDEAERKAWMDQRKESQRERDKRRRQTPRERTDDQGRTEREKRETPGGDVKES